MPITGAQGVPGVQGAPGAPGHHDPQGAGAECVTLHLADGTQRQADVLLACDGVHSALRQQLLGEERPRFTGLLAWRGLVPMQALPAHLRMAEGEAIGTNWVGPGGHVITYPVRGGTLMNVVGILERDDWRSESWTEPGSTEELLRDFTGWHADVQTLMTAIAEPFKWALLSRAPRSGWAQGRVCLLGDAAHPTLPFLAQGANMAIEDAAVIARCLDDGLRRAGDLTAALHRFETLRWQRTADIVNRSADNATRFHNPRLADPAYAEAYIDSEWDSEKVRHRYDWLFAYDALSG
jgi:salicylate hydroxylase